MRRAIAFGVLVAAGLMACGPDEGGLARDGGMVFQPPPALDAAPRLDMRVVVPPAPDVGRPPVDASPPPPADGGLPPPADQGPPPGDQGPPPGDMAALPPPDVLDGGIDGDGAPPPPPADGVCGGDQETAMIALVNQARANAGVALLECDSRVGNAARAHSAYLCEAMAFAFDGPNGEDAIDRIRAAGSDAQTYGAAISRGRSTAQRTFDSWSENEGIAATFVEEDLGRVGVGYVPCDDRHYWTLYVVD